MDQSNQFNRSCLKNLLLFILYFIDLPLLLILHIQHFLYNFCSSHRSNYIFFGNEYICFGSQYIFGNDYVFFGNQYVIFANQNILLEIYTLASSMVATASMVLGQIIAHWYQCCATRWQRGPVLAKPADCIWKVMPLNK